MAETNETDLATPGRRTLMGIIAALFEKVIGNSMDRRRMSMRLTARVRRLLGEVTAALAVLSVGCAPDTTDSQSGAKTPNMTRAGAGATVTAGSPTGPTAGTAGASTTPTGVFSGPATGTAGTSTVVVSAAGGGAKAGSAAPVGAGGSAATAGAPPSGASGTTGGAAGSTTAGIPPATGDGPPLPAIMGDCPEFK